MRLLHRVACPLVALALSLPGVAFAQGFHAVHTNDGIVVIASGDNGTLYRSFDSGANWTVQSLGGLTVRDIAGAGYNTMAVSDSGKIWSSANGGGTWALTVVSGIPDLRGVALPQSAVGVVVGGAGTIQISRDAGVTWSARSSGTGVRLNGVAFADTGNGWVCGEGGTLLRTTDGGETWNPVALGTANELLAVSAAAAEVWVVGAGGAAYRSSDGGANFAPVNLKLDTRSDVRAVRVLASGTVWMAGGGGFIRRSTDGGATWTFMQHRIHAPMTDIEVFGTNIWVTNSKNRTMTYSTDNGGFWRLPNLAPVTLSWGTAPLYPTSGQARGNTFVQNPVHENTLYCAIGEKVVRSLDAGDTWLEIATLPDADKCNAFLMSRRDSSVWLAAIGGFSISDRIVRTTDYGATWSVVLTADFGEYGVPLEMNPDRPDTVYFGGENPSGSGSPPTALRISTNFGATWSTLGAANFRSPCDIVVVPDSSNIILVGDGVTSSGRAEFWKSTDGGVNFTSVAQMPSGASEIPGMAGSRLNRSNVVGTNWSIGGVRRSTDYGSTWTQVDATTSAWGVDIAKDDPNVVIFGRYSGAGSAISTNGGTSWTFIASPAGWGNNYGMYMRDRGTIFCAQSSGIWKVSATYAYTGSAPVQSIALLAPNSGEVLAPGSSFNVTWNQSQIVLARIEYRRSPSSPWQFIAEVPGYFGAHSWTIPNDGTTQAQVRVSDTWDGVPASTSSGMFTILAPHLELAPSELAFGQHQTGSSIPLVLTLTNDGAALLNVWSLANALAPFHPGRASVSIPSGQSDTIGVWFDAAGSGSFADTLVIVSDDLGRSPLRVALSGSSIDPQLALLTPVGGESWPYGSVQDITWNAADLTTVDLDYRVHPDSVWVEIATGLSPLPASYAWTIPPAPTASAEVRIRGFGGTPADVCDAAFSLTSPLFVALPDTLRMIPAMIGAGAIMDTLHIENPGNAPLTISAIAIGGSEFWLGRSTLVIPAFASDTISIYYEPASEGEDTTVVTFTTDAPFGPHEQVVTGQGTAVADAAFGMPVASFALQQNRPNPFRGRTVIRYALPQAADVLLEVFDLRGNRVATLVRGREQAGVHSVSFGRGTRTVDGEALDALRSGVYFYRLAAQGRRITRKMLLVQ